MPAPLEYLLKAGNSVGFSVKFLAFSVFSASSLGKFLALAVFSAISLGNCGFAPLMLKAGNSVGFRCCCCCC